METMRVARVLCLAEDKASERAGPRDSLAGDAPMAGHQGVLWRGIRLRMSLDQKYSPEDIYITCALFLAAYFLL